MTAASTPEPISPRSRNDRRLAGFAWLASMAFALGSLPPTWVTTAAEGTLLATSTPGRAAGGLVLALLLVAAAAAGLAAWIRGVAGRVVWALSACAAVGAAAASGAVIADPSGAAQATLAARSGLIGADVQASVTMWPYVCIVACTGAALASSALVILRSAVPSAAPSPPAAVTQQTTENLGPVDDASAWRSLSGGDDPTTSG